MRLLGRDAAYVQNDFEGEPNVFPDTADADADHCGWLYRGDGAGAGADHARRARSTSTAPSAQRWVRRTVRRAMPVDPRDAVHTLAVIDAARTSAEGERVVEVITPGTRPGHTDEES